MKLLTTPAVRPGRVFVVEDGVLVVDDGNLADLVRVDGDDARTEIYVHPLDASAVAARWFECGVEKGRLN